MTTPTQAPGARLKAAIKNAGHTQREAARLLRVTEAHVSDICNDRVRPSLDLAARIEDAYGIPMRDFAEVA